MKILVTGGAGFLGSHIIAHLLKREENIICIDNFNDYYSPKIKHLNVKSFLDKKNFKLFRGDIIDFSFLENIFRKEKIKRVFHLAARAGVRPSIKDPFIYEKTNIGGTLNLLEISRRKGIENFVLTSSSSVYGNSIRLPFSEEDTALNPISPYAATKRSCELLAYTYHHLYGLNINIIRPFTIYGPAGRPDMAPFLFTKWIDEGRLISRFGNGSTKRDYTYIDDFVIGAIAALDNAYGYEIFNLGNSQPIRLDKFIDIIGKILKKKSYIKEKPIPSGDVVITFADISKAKKKLNYQPNTSIEEGMRKFIDWYQKNKQYYD